MNTLTKKMLRHILRSRGQTIAVTAVVLCGTACYICLGSLYRDLLLTRDSYYAEYRLADFEIMVDRVPATALFKLEEIQGVRRVRGRIVEELTVDIEFVDESRVGRLISMPNLPTEVLNDVVIMEGRYFQRSAENEVVLSQKFAENNDVKLGDLIDITLDARRYSLRVVGFGLSPEYVYMIRNIQELIPAPERFGILWVSEDFAQMATDRQAAYNNILGSVDNKDDLDRILDQAEDLLDSYGVFAKIKQEDQISNRFVSDEIKGLSVSSKIVPGIFLGISALVILVLLNRMVRNERTQIGLLKAYGYSNWAIAFHYLQYALILSVAGCVGGFFVGQYLAKQMIKIYVQFYQFPILRSEVYPEILVSAMGIAIFFALAGAIWASWEAARIQPAESMRPEAPRTATRTWVEKIPLLWKNLSFTSKMIVRNISRNRFRSSLNAFGVMISCGLLIVGFFSMDAMFYILRFQYEDTQRQDVKVSFVTEHAKDALHEIARLDNVYYAEAMLQYPFELRNEWRKKDTVVFGVRRHARLQKLLDTDYAIADIGDTGIVLSDHLATELNVTVGDTLTLKPLMSRIRREVDVQVTQVIEQYFGSSAYMNVNALSRVLNESFVMNAALLRIEPGTAHLLSEKLKDVPGVAAIEIKADSLQSLLDTIAQSMVISSMVILFFAGVISFSVIYNVTTVSLAERQRELASLRVLGFSKAEVGRIMYHENFLTGTIGLILGMPFGLGICSLLVHAYNTDLYRLPLYIENRTFVIAGFVTILFVALANFAVRRKIHALDLVEVLKEKE